MMTRSEFLSATSVGLLAGDAMLQPAPDADEKLSTLILPLRDKFRLPALCVAIVSRTNGVEASACVGVRKWGDPTPATVHDKFHLGSCTKAMTAMMVAKLDIFPRSGAVTLSSLLPEFSDEMRPEYQMLSVRHLLQHRAGLPGSNWPKGQSFDSIMSLRGTIREQRNAFIRFALKDVPAAPAGSKFIYSNAGYVIAAAVIEKRLNQSWEDSIAETLWKPLGITTGGFGPTGDPNAIDQPWPHRLVKGKPQPVRPDLRSDNPPALGPAGRAHMSILDWSKWISALLRKTSPPLVSGGLWDWLYTPEFGGEYAGGWNMVDRKWAGGRAWAHDGSNTLNYCTAWISHNKSLGFLVMTNVGGEGVQAACDEIVGELIRSRLS